MKKFIAILLAVLTVLSATSMMVFAADVVEKKVYPCTVAGCGAEFESADALATHTKNVHPETPAAEKPYTCDYCGKEFETTAAIKAHIEETFPVVGHCKECTNWTDKNFNGVKDEGEYCGMVFTTKVAYDSHAAVCDCKDTRSNADKMVDAFKAGNYGKAIEFLFKTIVEFVQSKEFKNAVDKIGTFVKGINFDKVVATVKDVVAKIPVDKITSLIKK